MIYLDNSATTRMYDELVEIIRHYSCDNFYNPSALYNRAGAVKQDFLQAKASIMKTLGATNGSLIITGSGTEADNMAMFCTKRFKNGKIVISAIEHSAIYDSARAMQLSGIDVDIIPVDRYGRVDMLLLKASLDRSVMLVSIMHVCNETGAINDLSAISKLVKANSPQAVFHSDGVQACGKIPINLAKLGVDLYSISSHKFHGMKGVGALYVRSGVHLAPLMQGGGQEGGKRPATENVCGAVCMARALEKCFSEFDEAGNKAKIQLIHSEVLSINPNFIINSDIERSISHILSIAIPDTKAEVLLHMLEDCGVIVGTGSACVSNKASSRVPESLGLPVNYRDGLLRISLSNDVSLMDVQQFAIIFNKCYSQLTANMLKKY